MQTLNNSQCELFGLNKLAKKMIAAAKKSGADAVKFQSFNTSSLAIKNTPKVDYQKKYNKNRRIT